MLRFPIAIVLFFALGGAFAPRSAVASCGDWLAHPESHVERMSVDDTRETPQPPVRSQRCNGPLCKQSPMGPIPSPNAPTNERYHQEVACTLRHGGNDCTRNARFDDERDLVLPVGSPRSIDRPPKS